MLLADDLPHNVAFSFRENPLDDEALKKHEIRSLLASTASDVRVVEFILGRLAANEAMVRLGVDDPPAVGIGQKREPIWPAGVTGSISHTKRAALSIAGFSSDWDGLGIDLEDDSRIIAFDISKKIADADESSWIDEVPEERNLRMLKLFCAKEAFYKAMFPVCQRFIGYEEVTMRWNPTASLFETTLLSDFGAEYSRGSRVGIKLFERRGFIATAALLPKKERAA